MSIGLRIASVRKTLGLSQGEFASQLGISQAKLSHYEVGRNDPDYETLVKISKLGSVTLDWLLTGEESTFTPPIADTAKLAGNAAAPQGNWFPVVGRVTAGDFQIFEDNVEGEVFMAYQHKNGCFAVLVEGNSMDGGKYPIEEGSHVLVDPSQTPLTGDLVVVLTEGRQMVKQLHAVKKVEIELKSFNTEYPVLYVNKDSVQKLLRVVYHQPQGKKW
jgi:phage repressor protein C with HTH and peptisase S24 domain